MDRRWEPPRLGSADAAADLLFVVAGNVVPGNDLVAALLRTGDGHARHPLLQYVPLAAGEQPDRPVVCRLDVPILAPGRVLDLGRVLSMASRRNPVRLPAGLEFPG